MKIPRYRAPEHFMYNSETGDYVLYEDYLVAVQKLQKTIKVYEDMHQTRLHVPEDIKMGEH